jgi:arabinogalactan endo-1,4-beta-galactosidase
LKIIEEEGKIIVLVSLTHRTVYRKRNEGLKWEKYNTSDILAILKEKGVRVNRVLIEDSVDNNDVDKLQGRWEFKKPVDKKARPVKLRREKQTTREG